MRRDPNYFGDQELDLLHIARKLQEALDIEGWLTAAEIDYLVEPDTYAGGVIFRTTRVGAFFYVLPDLAGRARSLLAEHGCQSHGLK